MRLLARKEEDSGGYEEDREPFIATALSAKFFLKENVDRHRW